MFFLFLWPNQHHVVTLMTTSQLLGLKGAVTTSQDKCRFADFTTTTTSTSVQSEHCTDFKHMRTSPPRLQHRDLNLCHDLGHYSFQSCLIHNSATQFHRSRDTFSTVSPPPDHIELLSHRDSRLCHGSQSKTAGWGPTASDDWAQFHEFLFRCTTRIQLCCFNSVSPSAAPRRSYNSGTPIRDRQKLSQALSSRRHPLWSALRR